jgi:hypothetical protein
MPGTCPTSDDTAQSATGAGAKDVKVSSEASSGRARVPP